MLRPPSVRIVRGATRQVGLHALLDPAEGVRFPPHELGCFLVLNIDYTAAEQDCYRDVLLRFTKLTGVHEYTIFSFNCNTICGFIQRHMS